MKKAIILTVFVICCVAFIKCADETANEGEKQGKQLDKTSESQKREQSQSKDGTKTVDKKKEKTKKAKKLADCLQGAKDLINKLLAAVSAVLQKTAGCSNFKVGKGAGKAPGGSRKQDNKGDGKETKKDGAQGDSQGDSKVKASNSRRRRETDGGPNNENDGNLGDQSTNPDNNSNTVLDKNGIRIVVSNEDDPDAVSNVNIDATNTGVNDGSSEKHVDLSLGSGGDNTISIDVNASDETETWKPFKDDTDCQQECVNGISKPNPIDNEKCIEDDLVGKNRTVDCDKFVCNKYSSKAVKSLGQLRDVLLTLSSTIESVNKAQKGVLGGLIKPLSATVCQAAKPAADLLKQLLPTLIKLIGCQINIQEVVTKEGLITKGTLKLSGISSALESVLKVGTGLLGGVLSSTGGGGNPLGSLLGGGGKGGLLDGVLGGEGGGVLGGMLGGQDGENKNGKHKGGNNAVGGLLSSLGGGGGGNGEDQQGEQSKENSDKNNGDTQADEDGEEENNGGGGLLGGIL